MLKQMKFYTELLLRMMYIDINEEDNIAGVLGFNNQIINVIKQRISNDVHKII